MSKKLFRDSLNKACGEISEAAKASADIFEEDDLKFVRRELARIMEKIDLELLARLKQVDKI